MMIHASVKPRVRNFNFKILVLNSQESTSPTTLKRDLQVREVAVIMEMRIAARSFVVSIAG